MFAYDLGDGIRIMIMNLAGKEILWGELKTVIQGLWQFLVTGLRGREVMFRFEIAGFGEVGWGWIAKNTPGAAATHR